LFGDRWDWGDRFITIVRLGAGQVISRDKIVYSNPIFNVAKKYLDSPKEGVAELQRIYAIDSNLTIDNLRDISIWAAYFGDLDFAMDAMEKSCSLNEEGVLFSWLPVMKEVRHTPRFNKYIKKIGLVDYWNKFGRPDICHKPDDGDFECD